MNGRRDVAAIWLICTLNAGAWIWVGRLSAGYAGHAVGVVIAVWTGFRIAQGAS